MSIQSKESRARLARHELQITEEACTKLRAYWLEQAVTLAAEAKSADAHNMLLRVMALDTIREMVRTPIDDWDYEQAIAPANTPN